MKKAAVRGVRDGGCYGEELVTCEWESYAHCAVLLLYEETWFIFC